MSAEKAGSVKLGGDSKSNMSCVVNEVGILVKKLLHRMRPWYDSLYFGWLV